MPTNAGRFAPCKTQAWCIQKPRRWGGAQRLHDRAASRPPPSCADESTARTQNPSAGMVAAGRRPGHQVWSYRNSPRTSALRCHSVRCPRTRWLASTTPGGRSATGSLVRKTTAGSISLACCSTEKADGTCLSPRSARVMRGAASHPIAAPRRRRSLSRDPPRFLLFFRLPLSRARHLRRSLIFAALTASPCPRGSGAGPSPAPCVR